MLLRWRIIPTVVICAIVGTACVLSFRGPGNIDFAAFWHLRQWMPYPPPYLLLIRPLSLLPYGLAFTMWVVVTGVVFVTVFRDRSAHPLAALNGLIGQNGFLTSSMMVGGLRLVSQRPALGGAILGLLIIKPHLAILLPAAIVGGRHWKAIPAATATATALCVLGLIVFGTGAYAQFFANAALYAAEMRGGQWPWTKLASVYAFARWFGLSDTAAMLAQAVSASIALVTVWAVWRDDNERKVPITAAASLLVSPYLFSYDALLLTASGNPVVWTLCCLPLLGAFGLYNGPNPIPICCLIVLSWPRLSTMRAPPIGATGALDQHQSTL